MSSAYRRDTSYSNGFALLTEEENREVLVSEFYWFKWYSHSVSSFFLFKLNHINSCIKEQK